MGRRRSARRVKIRSSGLSDHDRRNTQLSPGLPRRGCSGRALSSSARPPSVECHFHGIVSGMRVAIDRAGRIVVPKSLRQALGLRPGQPLEIRAGDGRLVIEIAATPMRLKKRGKGPVAVPNTNLPPLTAEQVRETLEQVRR